MYLKYLLLFSLFFVSLDAKPYKAKKIGEKTIHYSNGTIKKGGHRNWRNNNPGNLEYGKFAIEHGAIGTDGRFAIFPSMKAGYIAHVALLSGDKYKNLTLTKALKRFAPNHENNTKKYLSYLSKHTGIRKNSKLRYLSFEQKLKLVKYMAKYEGMKKGIYFRSGLDFSKTRSVLGKSYSHKYKRKTRKEIKTYAMRQAEKRFESILNPKKTRLHKILLSN